MSNRGFPLWERWEDSVLERDYTSRGWKYVQAQIPHRSKGAITTRANSLGLRGTKIRQRRKPIPPQQNFVVPWQIADVQACLLLRAWRGTVTCGHMSPSLGLRP